jgi:chromosome segregation ATPase
MRRTLPSILAFAAAFALLAAAIPAAAQETSVAEAARRAREQKKQAPKAKRVWTNDNLPQAPGSLSAAATSAAAEPAAGGAEAPAVAPGPSAEQEKESTALEAKFTEANANLARLKSELDLLRRDSDLQLQQFSSNPAANSDRAGRARIDALQAQVNAQAQRVTQAEEEAKKLEQELQALNARLGPKKEAPKNEGQQRTEWANRARPLREELARIEAEIARVRADAAQRGMSLYGVTAGGSPTADLLAQLENRRRDVLVKIAALEDEAQRAGFPLGWLR